MPFFKLCLATPRALLGILPKGRFTERQFAGQALVTEWINTTFPVAPGSGRHTFHNLACNAAALPLSARCGAK